MSIVFYRLESPLDLPPQPTLRRSTVGERLTSPLQQEELAEVC